jgi:hypothetical protein
VGRSALGPGSLAHPGRMDQTDPARQILPKQHTSVVIQVMIISQQVMSSRENKAEGTPADHPGSKLQPGILALQVCSTSYMLYSPQR